MNVLPEMFVSSLKSIHAEVMNFGKHVIKLCADALNLDVYLWLCGLH